MTDHYKTPVHISGSTDQICKRHELLKILLSPGQDFFCLKSYVCVSYIWIGKRDENVIEIIRYPGMKNIISFLAVASMMLFNLSGQSGKVMDNLSMTSAILKMERKYAIYLPPDYETSQRSYPVLYLLHGGGDDQTGWIQFGEVQYLADKAINQGKATPMIIVMPDANTGQRGYFNDIKGEWRYEDFFFQEFIPFIEKTISDQE